MKPKIKEMLTRAAAKAHESGSLPSGDGPAVAIEVPNNAAHGDFSTNFAMISAAVQKMAPRKIAAAIVDHLDDPDQIIAKTEIAGPGFINFYIHPHCWLPILNQIHAQGERFGACDLGRGTRYQVEFVSANPTGPLHVGHGRGAAVGDAVANILALCGFEVEREYYINDSGRQISTLGRSVFFRCRQLMGAKIDFPDDCYQGEYIVDFAKQIVAEKREALEKMEVDRAVAWCAQRCARAILVGIKADLAAFGVVFDRWFSEEGLYTTGKVDAVLTEFKARGDIYEKEGALWFQTSAFGDEKDRVVVRKNGHKTYFASDIAYHQDKLDRGFAHLIDVWGADHHGYIARVTAAIEASGYDPACFKVILVQLVNLLRDGLPVAMSTRAGEFVTLKDVVDEVGRDAARFIFLTRHYESPLDFDLEIASRKTNENPVYYVQYVHARISSIFRKAGLNAKDGLDASDKALSMLTQTEEMDLIKLLSRYPETVISSARQLEPHRITFYLMNLAAGFHAYYNKHRVLTDDRRLATGRLYLIAAVQQVIRNGLTLLGISAPEQM
jgi:arginyl-tRNA synthetase